MAGSLPYSPAPQHLSQHHSTMERPRPEYGYPSPTQMAVQSTYSYPPQQQQPQQQSPHLPPLNLPPIRVEQQQAAQQPPPGQPPMGSPLPPPHHGMPAQYYTHPPPPVGSQLGMGGMRYQLPPQPGDHQRVLSGGRHKKEIKRRTKTGCLTCRKRRIKCDEAHPTCRNCAKSKRDCLGYDPIFKPQPGPTQIQPAPSATPHPASSPGPAPPTTAPYSAQVPQGYAPAATAGYPPPPPVSAAGHASHENFNSAAIDPALAATDPAMHAQPPYNGVHAINPALRGSPYSAPVPEAPVVKGKPLAISDIFSIAAHNPPDVPPRPTPIPPELDDEFAGIFQKDYCVGLDVMLETRWYSTNNNALNRLFANRALHEEAIFFTETVKYRTSASDMSGVFSQEARLIWHMLASCKHTDPALNGTNGITAHAENDDLALKEVRARFDILEALLTNQNLESNPIRQLSYPTTGMPELKTMELEFWEHLGEFVVHADSPSAPPDAADYALSKMRSVLNAHEVRDAIYSIAIARHVGNRVRGFPNALPAVMDQNPESDLAKLNVAMSFISHECRSGTQQVIARICDMAMLSWTVSRS